MKVALKIIFLLFLTLLVWACNSEQNTQEGGDVLAQITDLKVTEEHFQNAFKRNYYRVGQTLVPSEANKIAVLESEFDVYVLAVFARDLELDIDFESFLQKGLIERKVFIEEYVNNMILEEVEVSEDDLRNLFLRYNTTLEAAHLYAPTKEEADSLYEMVLNGYSFEEIAQESFQNQYLAQNGGNIGSFTVDEMDIAFEDAAFGLEVGEISKPVKTNQGYSIIKLIDRFTIPVITEFQYASEKNSLRAFARQRNEERARRAHIENTISALNVNEEILSELWDDIRQNQAGILSHNFEGYVLNLSTEIDDSRVLASGLGFNFDVADLKQEGFYSPVENLNKVGNYFQFREYAKGLIYRTYLIEKFSETGMMNSSLVESSINQTFYNYLATRANEYLRSNIEHSEQELIEEFNSDRDMYDFPMMLNLSRIVVENENRGEEVLSLYNNGHEWLDLLKDYSIRNQDILIDGEMGLQPIQSFGLHAFQLQNAKEGEVIGPLLYQTGQVMLYKVLEVQEPKAAEFHEVEDLVRKVLTEKKIGQLRKDAIETTMEKHNAVLFEDRLNALTIEL